MAVDGRKHGLDDPRRGVLEQLQLLRRLDGPEQFERQRRGREGRPRQAIAQNLVGVHRQEARLDADVPDVRRAPTQCRHGGRCRLTRGHVAEVRAVHPELAEFALVVLHGTGDVGSFLGATLHIDEAGQVTAQPVGVHVGVEEVPVAAEHVLDVVLGCDQHRVEPGLVQQFVEPGGVERHGREPRRRGCLFIRRRDRHRDLSPSLPTRPGSIGSD